MLQTHGLVYEDRENVDNGTDQTDDPTLANIRRAIYQIITPSVDELVYEFHKMISYVRSEEQSPVFEGIYIYGCAAQIHHLDRYLQKRLGIPSKLINPLKKLELIDDRILPHVVEGAPFALALGLAMRKMTS